MQAAVVMRKDAENQVHYKDVGMKPAKGALAGTAIGAIIGIATGGASLVLGAAAVRLDLPTLDVLDVRDRRFTRSRAWSVWFRLGLGWIGLASRYCWLCRWCPKPQQSARYILKE